MWCDDYPSLALVRKACVVDDRESEHSDEESKRFVVIPDDKRYLIDGLRHSPPIMACRPREPV
jgi:hypothetical protein